MKNSFKPIYLSQTFLKIPLFLLFASIAFLAQSQPLWLPDTPNSYIGLEFIKPSFDNGGNTKFFTSSEIITGKFNINEKLSIRAELPFSNFSPDNGDSEFAIGNPYVGIELRKTDQPHFFEAGFRAPIASDEKFSALFTGLFSDYDRAEAFLTDLFSFSAKYNYLKKNDSNLILRFRGGPTFWFPTNGDDETEVLFDYSGQAGYNGSKFQVLGGFTGRMIISEDGDINERTIHQFGVSSHYTAKNVQPGILLRFPLDDDLNDFIDFVFGVNLLVNLN